MTKIKLNDEWLRGYNCAVIDFGMFVYENMDIMPPEAYKTLKKLFIAKFSDKIK